MNNVLVGENATSLNELWAGFPDPIENEEWSQLARIYAGGLSDQPALALVFINPTIRNQSASDRDWSVGRAPFIGLRRIWGFLNTCGLLPESAVNELPADGAWSQADAVRLYSCVARSGIYVTNVVKACRERADLPTMAECRAWLPLLEEELDMIKPRTVVTMGALPTSLLLGRNVRLADVLTDSDSAAIGTSTTRRGQMLTPCYFPVGRGNPAGARGILRRLASRT